MSNEDFLNILQGNKNISIWAKENNFSRQYASMKFKKKLDDAKEKEKYSADSIKGANCNIFKIKNNNILEMIFFYEHKKDIIKINGNNYYISIGTKEFNKLMKESTLKSLIYNLKDRNITFDKSFYNDFKVLLKPIELLLLYIESKDGIIQKDTLALDKSTPLHNTNIKRLMTNDKERRVINLGDRLASSFIYFNKHISVDTLERISNKASELCEEFNIHSTDLKWIYEGIKDRTNVENLNLYELNEILCYSGKFARSIKFNISYIGGKNNVNKSLVELVKEILEEHKYPIKAVNIQRMLKEKGRIPSSYQTFLTSTLKKDNEIIYYKDVGACLLKYKEENEAIMNYLDTLDKNKFFDELMKLLNVKDLTELAEKINISRVKIYNVLHKNISLKAFYPLIKENVVIKQNRLVLLDNI